MGLLVDGQWVDQWYDTKSTGGKFKRQDSAFRQWVKADGSTPFGPEAGRYHLYVSLACPWAHRTLLVRKFKSLEDVISLSIVDPLMLEHGWTFSDWPGAIADTVNHKRYLYEIYQLADPQYTGRVTVPVLWDKKTKTIVNNESAEILRMLNSEFNAFGNTAVDLCPEALRGEIDEINAFVYDNINNGVYKCGFATTQHAYEEAFAKLFAALDRVESILLERAFLAGGTDTEADWRLFTTLIRFDPVYVGHFKCNRNRIADFPALGAYLKKLYNMPGVAETVNFDHIKRHYYMSHKTINPTGIVPLGPEMDL